jgi:hypothetical protein
MSRQGGRTEERRGGIKRVQLFRLEDMGTAPLRRVQLAGQRHALVGPVGACPHHNQPMHNKASILLFV